MAYNSSIITFILSSNCPLYFVPATIDVMSKDTILLPDKFCGQSPSNIFLANPSTIAVLPHPGSPKMIGLFFFLLESIWAILLISSSLPTTGSNLPSSANFIKSLEKLSNTGVFVDPSWFLFFDLSLPSADSIIPILIFYFLFFQSLIINRQKINYLVDNASFLMFVVFIYKTTYEKSNKIN